MRTGAVLSTRARTADVKVSSQKFHQPASSPDSLKFELWPLLGIIKL
jgi:hypothetical protein